MNHESTKRLPDKPSVDSNIRSTYCFRETGIGVDIDDPDVARWLEEFLSLWFPTTSSITPGLRIRMVSSLERFSALVGREAGSNLQSFPCFSLDSALVSLPGWIEADGTTLVADREFGCYYQIQGNHIEVISRPQDRSARIGLMRVLREIAMSLVSVKADTLELHAAAFEFRGRAILLGGNKRAGKTTLLAHALTSRHTCLMANDRVHVDGQTLEAYGVPTVVLVRRETEQIFPNLGRMLPRRAVICHAGELASADFQEVDQARPLALSLSQFARQLNSEVQPRGPIGAILFPQISPSTSTLSLIPLNSSEAITRLRTSIYGSRLTSQRNTIFQRVPPNTDGRDSLVERLATAVPQISCLLGKDAYSKNPDDWLGAIPLHNETSLP